MSRRKFSSPPSFVRSRLIPRLFRECWVKPPKRFQGRSPGSRSGYGEVAALSWDSLLGRANWPAAGGGKLVQGLDADHLRSHVAQEHCGVWPGVDDRHIGYANAIERAASCSHCQLPGRRERHAGRLVAAGVAGALARRLSMRRPTPVMRPTASSEIAKLALEHLGPLCWPEHAARACVSPTSPRHGVDGRPRDSGTSPQRGALSPGSTP